jgi:hypothetical protein
MGWLDKIIPKEIKKPFKAVGKLSKKFLPKELRPWLPMATAFMPYTGIMGAMGGMGGFGKMYLTNLLAQQAADPDAEFDDLNQLSAFLSGTQGGLMGTKTAGKLADMTTRGMYEGTPHLDQALENRSLLTKAKDLGITGLSKASEYLQGGADTLGALGSGEEINIAKAGEAAIMKDLFTKQGAIEAAKAATVPFAKGMGDVTEAYQRPEIRDWEAADAAEQAQMEETTTANEQEQADLTMKYYRQAGHDEDTIQEALEINGLGDYYVPPVEEAAQGGRIGYAGGQLVSPKADGSRPGYRGERFMINENWRKESPDIGDFFHQTGPVIGNRKKILEGFTQEDWENLEDQGGGILDILIDILKTPYIIRGGDDSDWFNKRDGGIIGLKHGGMLNLGGNEMDYRGGGFVPIGKKERADDVPARLSKNEFVMTADAVRAAGGGDVNKGAQRMYNVMNNLEARA